jgi:hypothetical protein
LGTGRDARGLSAAKPTTPLWDRMRQFHISEGQLSLWNQSQQDTRAFLQEYAADLPVRKRDRLRAFLRCQTSRSRFVRVATFLRYGFYYPKLKLNVAMMLHLWKMKANEH